MLGRYRGQIRHGRQKTPTALGSVARCVAVVTAIATAAAAGIVSLEMIAVSQSLNDGAVDIGGASPPPPPPFLGALEGGFTMLVVGTDNDAKQGDDYGERDATLNDVNILLHVSADHREAVVVSLPRDLVIAHPECEDPETGDASDPMAAAPLNLAWQRGGLGCATRTISELTGLPITYAAATSFLGVIAMTNAVGGVDICLSGPVFDSDSGLDLPAGISTVSGQTALSFLRTRHGVGDGSDLTRIGSQQQYLSSLLRKIRADSTLADPGRLFALASAAGDNIIPSTSLGGADTLVSLALTLKDIDLSSIVFVQYPTEPYSENPNKVQPNAALAEDLLTHLAADEPFSLPAAIIAAPADDTADPNEPPADLPPTTDPTSPAETPPPPLPITGLTGQTAAQSTCATPFHD